MTALIAMLPDPATSPVPTPAPEAPALRGFPVVPVAALILAAIVAAGAYTYFFLIPKPAGDTTPSKEVLQSMSTGDYTSALTAANEFITSNAAADEKALTRIAVSTLTYGMSGNIDDALASIRELKAIAADMSLSPEV